MRSTRQADNKRRSRFRLSLLGLVLFLSNLAAEEPKPTAGPPTADDYDAFVKPSDRDHWSFKTVVRPPIPKVADAGWVRNPIDAFVLAKLEGHQWRPNPPAGAPQLLRRMYLDVIGLPPNLEEQSLAGMPEGAAERFDQLVDQLLSRPEYGERWGRHWLDLVRYAETNGYERDGTKPNVWRYRDYVIQSLNQDKPYDRFILEQLAGDELPDASTETVIATGYYRLGPWDDEPADPKEDRYEQLEDMVNTTSQVFLGMTLACARCHNHKFEPYSTLDYYRMAAIFNTLQRPQAGRADLGSPAGSREQLAREAARDQAIQERQHEIDQRRTAIQTIFLTAYSGKLPAEAVAAFQAVPDKRNDAQKKLVQQHQAALDLEVTAALPEATRREIREFERQQQELRATTPDLPRGYFFTEPRPNPPVTNVLLRGKATAPGTVAEPGLPRVLVTKQPPFPASTTATSQRRLILANWIASRENPLTARVIVNRVWQFHFGEGLVRTPSDYGVMGHSPTHPELLDWLADWFVNEGGWSLKKLHRLILTSNSYRMSKAWNAEYGAKDPTNDRLWRMPYRRLDVEPLCDAMLVATGQLNRQMGGPSMYPFVPRQALEGHSDPNAIWKPFDERDASRRTVYSFIKRSMVVPLLEVLDLCDTTRSAAQRNVTSVAPQALAMLNGDFVNRQSQHLAARVEREAGADRRAQIVLAWRLTLCREPTEHEVATMLQFLQEARQPPIDGHQALVQMCRALFNLNEFAYTD
ncbi:MAG: Planctomycete cytochrome [Planctomycetaceae bacterium]|nr:Planctomycete cytochrome [Planctomycetaceae bacterium]